MLREERDVFISTLRGQLETSYPSARFPLDVAVAQIGKLKRAENQDQAAHFSDLLDLFEVTSVSAALAIKRLGIAANDTSGIRDALVELWGRAEAARSLLFDVLAVWTSTERRERQEDLWETARLLAPEAIAIAMRLSEPVSQYVEFASKVISQGARSTEVNSLEIPRA
ncbi:MAG: hypothetical protein ACK5GN_13470 [Pseudomonadota bacterium]|jgi:hypothetical protein